MYHLGIMLREFAHKITAPTFLGRNPGLVLATDFEGPLVLGDTAAEIMNKAVQPEGNTFPGYGKILYDQTYTWYTNTRWKNRYPLEIAQEGTDINFTLAILLACGIDQNYINQVALETRFTPGAKSFLDYLRDKNSLVIAVTTAWDEPCRKIAENLGLDYLVATPFPIDAIRSVLIEKGSLETEMTIVQRFLVDAHPIINKLHQVPEKDSAELTKTLHQRIGLFFEEELGINLADQHRNFPTYLGEAVSSIEVVGDSTKARVAREVFEQFSPDLPTVTMGDGLNDIQMLREGKFSIGINGPDAVRAAKIGVITPNVSDALIPLFEIMLANPEIEISDLIAEALKLVDKRYIKIHPGGSETAKDLIEQHKQMKRYLRGNLGTLIP